MSSKRRLAPFKILSAQSLAGDSASTPSNIQLTDNVGIQIDVTGSPVGTFNVQVSLDYARDAEGNVTNAGTWATITTQALSAAGNTYININQCAAPWIRLQYVHTSGSGAADAWITGKML